MEYDFHRNIYGLCEAKLSMGHEAFGNWINGNLNNAQQCEDILQALRSAHKEIKSSCGHFTITLQNNEISIESHNLSDNSEIEDDQLDYYDDELSAHCGKEDFIDIIVAWRDFIDKM